MKELLAPSVTALVDGLPFTTEGYERAKNILKQRYGKTSVIVNAHVSNIMSLLFHLRCVAKQVIRSCYGCRRFQAHAFAVPPPGRLPTHRTQGDI